MVIIEILTTQLIIHWCLTAMSVVVVVGTAVFIIVVGLTFFVIEVRAAQFIVLISGVRTTVWVHFVLIINTFSVLFELFGGAARLDDEVVVASGDAGDDDNEERDTKSKTEDEGPVVFSFTGASTVSPTVEVEVALTEVVIGEDLTVGGVALEERSDLEKTVAESDVVLITESDNDLRPGGEAVVVNVGDTDLFEFGDIVGSFHGISASVVVLQQGLHNGRFDVDC